MRLTRRALVRNAGRAGLGLALAAPALRRARAAYTLSLGHSFPAGGEDEGDFRDRLARRFAAEVGQRTGGQVVVQVYAGAQLTRPAAQFSALSHGALDLAVIPLDEAARDVPATQIALMPGLVGSLRQGFAWRDAPVGVRLSRLLLRGGVQMVSWAWAADGIASTGAVLQGPETLRGLRVRSVSAPMAAVLRAAGATVVPVAVGAAREALASGRIDAALASSATLRGTGMLAASHALTTATGGSPRIGLVPILASRKVMDALPAPLRAQVLEAGAAVEPFALEAATADDRAVATDCARAGIASAPLTPEALERWRDLASGTAWRSYAALSATNAELLRLAQDVPG